MCCAGYLLNNFQDPLASRHQTGDIQHPLRETPFVVIPPKTLSNSPIACSTASKPPLVDSVASVIMNSKPTFAAARGWPRDARARHSFRYAQETRLADRFRAQACQPHAPRSRGVMLEMGANTGGLLGQRCRSFSTVQCPHLRFLVFTVAQTMISQ